MPVALSCPVWGWEAGTAFAVQESWFRSPGHIWGNGHGPHISPNVELRSGTLSPVGLTDTQLVPSYGTPPAQPAAHSKHPQTFFPCQLWRGQFSSRKLRKVFALPTGHDTDHTAAPSHQGLNGPSMGLWFWCAVEAVLIGREPCVREMWGRHTEHHQAPHACRAKLCFPHCLPTWEVA